MRPIIHCPGCDERKPGTRHHIMPLRFWGRKNNNHILLICRECHNELERHIPKYEQMPKAFYHAIVKVFLEVLCKKARAQSIHRLFDESDAQKTKE